MKPLKGYKDITDFIIRRKCEHPGCTKDSDIPMEFDEETSVFSLWLCVEHAMMQLNREREEAKNGIQ